jgi:hypothetical protein
MTRAYQKATKEFVALRARHEMATMAAEIEARHYGAEFKFTPFVSLHPRFVPSTILIKARNERLIGKDVLLILSIQHFV